MVSITETEINFIFIICKRIFGLYMQHTVWEKLHIENKKKENLYDSRVSVVNI